METFVIRAFKDFNRNVRSGFSRANRLRRNTVGWVLECIGNIYRWELEHKVGLVIGMAVIIWLGLVVWFFMDVARGRVEGSAVQTGVGGAIGGAILSSIVSPVIAIVFFLVLLLLSKLLQSCAAIILFASVTLWVLLYAQWQGLAVFTKLLLLIPLSLLVIVTRLAQLWRRIFFTCPGRGCTCRGFPDHVCPDCGGSNPKLWPNLYGLFRHHCAGCDNLLPTLSVFGRGRARLDRRCGHCGFPLRGKHAGKVPERLVAIAGGPGSGKTCYLISSVHHLTSNGSGGSVKIRGAIDDPSQAREFADELKGFSQGRTTAKTVQVGQAFLLYAKVNGSWCQLYLYDAPGEEFASISTMSRNQYFPLLEGIILMVDPESFEGVGSKTAGRKAMPLQKVVDSTLGATIAGQAPNSKGKFGKRVAIVISKADMQQVTDCIGDVRQKPVLGSACRDAIVKWGGRNAVQAIENQYEAVEYFACSPLGRNPSKSSSNGFNGSGVLEPLFWILTGKDPRRAA